MASELEKRAEDRANKTAWPNISLKTIYAYGWITGFNECLYELQNVFILSGNSDALCKVNELIKLDKEQD